MSDEKLGDRARGALVGLALGDCLGAPHEFKVPPFEVKAEFDYGRFGHSPGEGTDDTTLAVLCGEALLTTKLKGLHRARALVSAYPPLLVAWAQSGPPDIGNQTCRAVVAWEKGEFPPLDEEAQGNGSLMACSPIALAFLDDAKMADDTARDFARLTHPSQMAMSCNARFVRWLRDALHGRYPITSLPDLDLPAVSGPGMGRCSLTLTLAATTLELAEAVGPLEALLQLIRMGGDTDTNAAVAGALLGARWGIDAWPTHLLDELVPADHLIELADALVGP